MPIDNRKFLRALSARLETRALNDAEMALIVLAALTALGKVEAEPQSTPAALARSAMDFVRKVGTILPDKGRDVRQILPHGGLSAPAEEAIAFAITRHRDGFKSYFG